MRGLGGRRTIGVLLIAGGVAVGVLSLAGVPNLEQHPLPAVATGALLLVLGTSLLALRARLVGTIVVTLALLAVVLGLGGYLAAGLGLLPAVYATLILFAGEFTSVGDGVPPVLEVGRLAAMGAVSSTVLALLHDLSGGRLRAWRAERARDHVVVVGLGDTGSALALAFRAQGRSVVAAGLELDPVRVAPLRDRGVLVVQVDATAPRAARRLGAARADAVLAATDNDPRNVQVLRHLAAEAGPGPRYLAYTDDLALCEELRSTAGYGAAAATPGLDFFNIYENVAQDLARGLLTAPLAGRSAGDLVSVIGTSPLAVALVLQLRRQSLSAPLAVRPLRVLVVEADASAEVARWTRAWDELRPADGWALDALDVSSSDAAALLEAAEQGGWAHACVCVSPTAASRQLGVLLARRRPTVVWVTGAQALGPLLTPSRPHLQLVDVLEEGIRPELVEDDVRRLLGRAAHSWYLAEQAAAPERERRTLQPWQQLSRELQDDNVAQVDHLRQQLARRGYELVPWTSEAVPAELSEPLVQSLAQQEHERWRAARVRKGWTYGPDRDRRQHSDLIDWEQLDRHARAKDVEAVRRFPWLVASIGYSLVQQPPPSAAAD